MSGGLCLHIRVMQVENGYIIAGVTDGNARPHREWIAKDIEDLGDLVKALAVAARLSSPTTGDADAT
jgi:hypothetical protein